MATSRAPRACFALPSGSRRVRVGTRRTCTTPLTSSPRKPAPRRWGQPLALASTSMHLRGSQCVPVTRCAPRLAALGDHSRPHGGWSSPGSVPTCPSSRVTRAYMGTSLTRTCCAVDGHVRASVSVLLSGDLLNHSWWQATTGGLGLHTARIRRQPHHVPPSVVHHGRQLQSRLWRPEPVHHGRVRRSHRRSPRAPCSYWDSLTKLWPSASFPGATSSLGVEDAMQDLPTPSLRHARGRSPDDGDGDEEHPLARKRLKIQALITTCVHLGLLEMHEEEGSWRGPRVAAGTWGCRGRSHVDVALEPAPRCSDGAQGVRSTPPTSGLRWAS